MTYLKTSAIEEGLWSTLWHFHGLE